MQGSRTTNGKLLVYAERDDRPDLPRTGRWVDLFHRGMLIASVAMLLIGVALGQPWLIVICWVPMIAASLLLVLGERGRTRVLLTRLVAWFSGGIVVEAMDYTNERYITVVWPRDAASWHGWLRWQGSQGYLVMTDRGLVDPEHGCGHVYLWRPIDRSKEFELMLRCDDWPEWQRWQDMDHREKSRLRKSILES